MLQDCQLRHGTTYELVVYVEVRNGRVVRCVWGSISSRLLQGRDVAVDKPALKKG